MSDSRQTPQAGHQHWRHAARVLAVQAIFQLDARGDEFAEMVRRFVHDRLDTPDAAELFVNGRMPVDLNGVEAEAIRLTAEAWRGREVALALLTASAINWHPDRISAMDRAVLLVAIAELKGASDAPHAVVMDEAIDIARTFGGEDSPRFINGVLDAVCRRITAEQAAEPTLKAN